MSTSNLKISVAALSLCVSAVAIYIHLPYVIAAVSGSGAIEAVPLAIFTVSAVIALIAAIYLIRLAVSRADNKKKAAPDGEQPTNKSTGIGSNDKLNDTNASKNSSPSSLPPPPPPPPSPLLNSATRKNSANTTDEEPPVNAASKSSSPKVPIQCIVSPLSFEESSIYKKAQVKHNADNMLDPRKLDDEKIKAEKLNLKGAASSPPPVMFGTQSNPNVSVPPLPLSQLLQDAAFPPPPPAPSSSGTLLPKEASSPSMSEAGGNMFAQIKARGDFKLKNDNNKEEYYVEFDRLQEERKKELKYSNIGEVLKKKVETMALSDSDSESKLSDHENDWDDKQDEQNLAADEVPVTDATVQQESQSDPLPKEVKSQQSNVMDTTNLGHSNFKIVKGGIQLTQEELNELSKKRKTMEYSDSESDSDNELNDDENEYSTPLNLPSGREERSESPDSGYGDDVGSRATSPLHPEQKTEESLVPPSSCIDSPSAAQVNNVDPVDNEVQDPPTLPFKERIKLLNSQRGGSVFPS